VVEGKYVSQWYHDWSLERANETYSENTGAFIISIMGRKII
jgi:hypothetical protein